MGEYGFKCGFTLAEVLISITIIGIVAMLVMPGLISSHKKRVTSVRLRKFYAAMQQVIKLSEMEHGQYNKWGWEQMRHDEEGNYEFEENIAYTAAFVKKYITPYMSVSSIEDGYYTELSESEEPTDTKGQGDDGKDNLTYTKVYLTDGTSIRFFRGACLDITFDVNSADKQPNKVGEDKFYFAMCYKSSHGSYHRNKGFQPYMIGDVPTREEALQKCKEQRAYCSSLLYYDDWEFKDDYPYKL